MSNIIELISEIKILRQTLRVYFLNKNKKYTAINKLPKDMEYNMEYAKCTLCLFTDIYRIYRYRAISRTKVYE